MKRIVIALTFSFLTFLSFSQETNTSPEEHPKNDDPYLYGGFRINFFSSSFNAFQDILEGNDFAQLEEFSTSFEGYIRDRSKSGWERSTSFGFYQRKTVNKLASNQASLIGLTSCFESGYNLNKKNNFIFKPFLGFGFEYYKLSFVENFQSSSLSNIANSEFKNYNATSFQTPGTIGLEIGTSIRNNFFIINILLRGGYKFHLENDTWKIDDVLEINDEINLSSPFVGMSLGFTFLK